RSALLAEAPMGVDVPHGAHRHQRDERVLHPGAHSPRHLLAEAEDEGVLGKYRGGLKQIVGGNITEYAEVCEAARHQAYVDMLKHAEQMGADAIIGMRYDAAEFAAGVTEVLAYGTAVNLARG